MSIIDSVKSAVFTEKNLVAAGNFAKGAGTVASKVAAPVATGFLIASGAILAANLLVPKGHLERSPKADQFEKAQAAK